MSYITTADEKGLKRLISAFISPPTYDFWSRQLGSTHAWSRCYARVIARRAESSNTFTLRLAPNGNIGRFAPGQHVNLTTEIGGRRVTRSYSFSNAPNDDGWVEITVRHDPSGLMSNWLFDNADKGTVLELEKVFGAMTSDTFSELPLLLLAGGSGITPLMSLLREQASLGMPRRVTLVYWERNDTSFCFTQDLQAIAERFDNFAVHTIATMENESRRISTAQLTSLGVDTAGVTVLACGSSAFVDRARLCTAEAAASFQSEAFTARPFAVADEAPRNFTVKLLSSNRSIEVSNQESLLTALERQGIVVQSGCRMGVCNTCSCKKVTGSTWNAESAETDSNTNSSVRLCITRATSDLTLAI